MTLSRKAARGLGVLSLVTGLDACADNVTGPLPSSSALVVSDPVPNGSTAPAASGSAHGRAASSLGTAEAAAGFDVAYVSLQPNTYPSGETAVIANARTGSIVRAPMVGGGLDPVPMPAVAGDTVEIDILLAGGVSVALIRARVPERRRPRVVRTVPPRGKTDVTINGRVVVVFSEPVDEASLSPPSVQLFRGASAVPGTARLLQGVTAAVVFEPALALEPNTEYRLVVTEGVHDLDGDALETPVTTEFTTGTAQEGPVASLSLVPDAADVRVGTQFQLIVTAYDAQGTVLTGRPVVWSSTNPSVATVSTTGLVTASAQGTAFIDAEVEGWFVAIFVRVSETMGLVGSVTLTADSASVTPGGTIELAAEARDAEGNLVERRLVVWTSSNPAVASVAPSATDRAVVTGVANGVVRIAATIDGKSDTTLVTVGPPPPIVGFIISPDTATMLLHATVQLSGHSRNAVGGRTPVTGTTAQWQTSDAAVVSVDSTGLVTAVGAGSATITATWNGFRTTARMTVIEVMFETVSAGRYHTCGLTPNGAAYCWGATDFGQAGRPGLIGGLLLPRILITAPVLVAEGLTFTAVSAGSWHTCGITTSGVAHCWGYGGTGALGNGSFGDSWRAMPVAGGLNFVAVDAGVTHTCGLTAGGAAYCWGSNRDGELGNGTSTRSPIPVAVAGGLAFRAVSIGESHTCGLTAAGAAYCWGKNLSGQLGIGDTAMASSTPRAVAGGHLFALLSAGAAHTCGFTTTGAAFCWGWNFDGQLGNSISGPPSPTPAAVTGALSFAAIDAGRSHTCAVEASSVAYCWGQNLSGRLGFGTTTAGVVATPQRVAGGLAFTRLSAGGAHTCALATDSAWYCWGENETGALGVATAVDSGLPVKVLGQR